MPLAQSPHLFLKPRKKIVARTLANGLNIGSSDASITAAPSSSSETSKKNWLG
jgi:hypothetical protein